MRQEVSVVLSDLHSGEHEVLSPVAFMREESEVDQKRGSEPVAKLSPL
jgi:hypothetical protein